MRALPKGFPHRVVEVPGWVAKFKAPRHVVRIDVNEPGKAGTHGWQVRYGPRPWRFFGDSRGANLRSPHQSLAEARRHLTEIYDGPQPRVRTTVTRRKRNPPDEPGIRLVEKPRRGGGMVEVYVEAVPPSRAFSPRRFYVGTKNTLTPERMELAKAKARLAREFMVFLHLEAQRERGFV